MANNGNKGRFSDRIKKIRFDRFRKKRVLDVEDRDIAYKNILKVVAVIPLIVVDNIFDSYNDKNTKIISVDGKKYVIENGIKKNIENSLSSSDRSIYLQRKKINRQKVESIDVSLLKKKQLMYEKMNKNKENSQFKETFDDKLLTDKKDNVGTNFTSVVFKDRNDNEHLDNSKSLERNNTLNNPKVLEKQIIDLIKKDLVKMLNELEIYESDLFILNEINNDEKTLNECRDNIKEVKKILAKIEQLKEKYDFLKDNYDFEYLLEINNEPLINKIIELKNMFDNNEVKATVSDYKILEVYKSLYLKVDEIYDKTYKIEEDKLKKEEELKERDINFKKLKEKVYNVDRYNDSYNYFVQEQNNILKSLSDKISKIDSREVIDYTVKGYGRYLANSFKYIGLLMLSPLRGLFPSIAVQTLVTRNTVNQLRKGIVFEEHKRMVYEATDFSNMINYGLNDLDSTGRMVDATLDDLIKLKMDYIDKFKKYQGDFLEYRDVINKINSLQENMINNKIKLEIMKDKMKQYERENNKKIELVKKLNKNEENRKD